MSRTSQRSERWNPVEVCLKSTPRPSELEEQTSALATSLSIRFLNDDLKAIGRLKRLPYLCAEDLTTFMF